jgi:hypothetical protein
MKNRPPRLNLMERALIERDWHHTVVSAQIHALYGDNSQGMVDTAGRVLYVVLGAALTEGVDPEREELQAVRSAVSAMHDQIGEPEIPETRRARIVGGLEASERLIPHLPRVSLIRAACDLKEKLKNKHILLSDFEALVQPSQSPRLSET